jgi:hypothetical protein
MNPSKMGEFEIYMRKGACYGTCPYYELRINEAGIALLDGKQHLPHIGIHEKEIPYEQLQELVRAFEEENFFDLNDTYMEDIPDIQTIVIRYQKQDRKKEIAFNMGYPKALENLVKRLSEIGESETGWEAVKE